MFILGILVFLGCTGLLMFMSGNFGWYIDIPSLLLVLPPALVLTMGVTSKAAMKRAFRTIVDDELQATRDELVESQHVFNTFGNCALWLGGIGLIIGFIAIGGSLNAEDFAKVIGPAMAIAMTTILYALFIKTLCYVAAQKVSTLILRAEING